MYCCELENPFIKTLRAHMLFDFYRYTLIVDISLISSYIDSEICPIELCSHHSRWFLKHTVQKLELYCSYRYIAL